MTNNPCYGAGKKIKVSGLMLHSVGCPQSSANVFVKKLNRMDAKVCVHAFIDGDTGKVYQTLPWDTRAWHCGGSGNNTYIGIEMCEPNCIKYTGGATFSCSNYAEAEAVVKRTLQAAVSLFAHLCKQFGLDPLESGVIVSHKEGSDRGIASGHGDPDHLFAQLNMSYSMDEFRKAVAAEIEGAVMENQNAKAQTIEVGGKKEQHNISVGDIVSLKPSSTYYTGKTVPEWVEKEKWFVKSVHGDRILLGKNVSGTHEINSPVNSSSIANGTELLKSDASRQQEGATNLEEKQIVTDMKDDMSISDEGVELVAKYEGCKLEAYKCPAGVWTIGYGHTEGVSPGDKISTEKEAKELLKKDLAKYGGYVNTCRKNNLISFPMKQNQFDALTSFCYNCGYNSLKKLVADRTADVIAEKILLYNKAGGKELSGLTKRRAEERALFIK